MKSFFQRIHDSHSGTIKSTSDSHNKLLTKPEPERSRHRTTTTGAADNAGNGPSVLKRSERRSSSRAPRPPDPDVRRLPPSSSSKYATMPSASQASHTANHQAPPLKSVVSSGPPPSSSQPSRSQQTGPKENANNLLTRPHRKDSDSIPPPFLEREREVKQSQHGRSRSDHVPRSSHTPPVMPIQQSVSSSKRREKEKEGHGSRSKDKQYTDERVKDESRTRTGEGAGSYGGEIDRNMFKERDQQFDTVRRQEPNKDDLLLRDQKTFPKVTTRVGRERTADEGNDSHNRAALASGSHRRYHTEDPASVSRRHRREASTPSDSMPIRSTMVPTHSTLASSNERRGTHSTSQATPIYIPTKEGRPQDGQQGGSGLESSGAHQVELSNTEKERAKRRELRHRLRDQSAPSKGEYRDPLSETLEAQASLINRGSYSHTMPIDPPVKRPNESHDSSTRQFPSRPERPLPPLRQETPRATTTPSVPSQNTEKIRDGKLSSSFSAVLPSKGRTEVPRNRPDFRGKPLSEPVEISPQPKHSKPVLARAGEDTLLDKSSRLPSTAQTTVQSSYQSDPPAQRSVKPPPLRSHVEQVHISSQARQQLETQQSTDPPREYHASTSGQFQTRQSLTSNLLAPVIVPAANSLSRSSQDMPSRQNTSYRADLPPASTYHGSMLLPEGDRSVLRIPPMREPISSSKHHIPHDIGDSSIHTSSATTAIRLTRIGGRDDVSQAVPVMSRSGNYQVEPDQPQRPSMPVLSKQEPMSKTGRLSIAHSRSSEGGTPPIGPSVMVNPPSSTVHHLIAGFEARSSLYTGTPQTKVTMPISTLLVVERKEDNPTLLRVRAQVPRPGNTITQPSETKSFTFEDANSLQRPTTAMNSRRDMEKSFPEPLPYKPHFEQKNLSNVPAIFDNTVRDRPSTSTATGEHLHGAGQYLHPPDASKPLAAPVAYAPSQKLLAKASTSLPVSDTHADVNSLPENGKPDQRLEHSPRSRDIPDNISIPTLSAPTELTDKVGLSETYITAPEVASTVQRQVVRSTETQPQKVAYTSNPVAIPSSKVQPNTKTKSLTADKVRLVRTHLSSDDLQNPGHLPSSHKPHREDIYHYVADLARRVPLHAHSGGPICDKSHESSTEAPEVADGVVLPTVATNESHLNVLTVGKTNPRSNVINSRLPQPFLETSNTNNSLDQPIIRSEIPSTPYQSAAQQLDPKPSSPFPKITPSHKPQNSENNPVTSHPSLVSQPIIHHPRLAEILSPAQSSNDIMSRGVTSTSFNVVKSSYIAPVVPSRRGIDDVLDKHSHQPESNSNINISTQRSSPTIKVLHTKLSSPKLLQHTAVMPTHIPTPPTTPPPNLLPSLASQSNEVQLPERPPTRATSRSSPPFKQISSIPSNVHGETPSRPADFLTRRVGSLDLETSRVNDPAAISTQVHLPKVPLPELYPTTPHISHTMESNSVRSTMKANPTVSSDVSTAVLRSSQPQAPSTASQKVVDPQDSKATISHPSLFSPSPSVLPPPILGDPPQYKSHDHLDPRGHRPDPVRTHQPMTSAMNTLQLDSIQSRSLSIAHGTSSQPSTRQPPTVSLSSSYNVPSTIIPVARPASRVDVNPPSRSMTQTPQVSSVSTRLLVDHDSLIQKEQEKAPRIESEDSILTTPSSLALSTLKPTTSRTSIPASTSSQQESRKKGGILGIFRSKTPQQQHEIWHPQISNISSDHKAHRSRAESYSNPDPDHTPMPTSSSKRHESSPAAVPIPIPSGRKSPNIGDLTSFRHLTTKRNRTMSAASVEAQDGTAPNTVVGSPTASMYSQTPLQPPPLRDPLIATQEWRNREEAETRGRSGGKIRRRRPGVVFDVGEEPPEDKQRLRSHRSRGSSGHVRTS